MNDTDAITLWRQHHGEKAGKATTYRRLTFLLYGVGLTAFVTAILSEAGVLDLPFAPTMILAFLLIGGGAVMMMLTAFSLDPQIENEAVASLVPGAEFKSNSRTEPAFSALLKKAVAVHLEGSFYIRANAGALIASPAEIKKHQGENSYKSLFDGLNVKTTRSPLLDGPDQSADSVLFIGDNRRSGKIAKLLAKNAMADVPHQQVAGLDDTEGLVAIWDGENLTAFWSLDKKPFHRSTIKVPAIDAPETRAQQLRDALKRLNDIQVIEAEVT